MARAGLAQPRACPFCANEFPSSVHRLPGRLECPVCHVQVSDPWPSDEELTEAYSTFYRPDSGRFSGPGDVLLRRARGSLARRIDVIAPPGPVLDVGAGDGALLDALHALGRRAEGLERTRTRRDIRVAEIDEVEAGWAAIVMWHALEHLRRPGEALTAAAQRLKPGGVLLVAVPNISSIQAQLFAERWFALDIPRHLTHIPSSTLIEALIERRLKVERVSAWRGGQVFFGWADGLVGRFVPGHPSLYDAIRKPSARGHPMAGATRMAALTGAVVLSPVAAAGSVLELVTKRGGTTYVEARAS
jgi:SAM-dependent methyltransferase